MFRTLDQAVHVWGQVTPEDVAAAKADGFAAVINNRPDDEQPGQPTGAEIEAAARAHGLAYTAIPVDHSGFREDQVTAMAEALESAPGPVLAFAGRVRDRPSCGRSPAHGLATILTSWSRRPQQQATISARSAAPWARAEARRY